MPVGALDTRCALVLAGAIACGDRSPERAVKTATPLDVAIAQQLGARLGVPIAVRCPTAQACEAVLPDRGTLPISVRQVAGGWDWHVDGLIVTTDQLEAYLRDEVAALGAAQAVRCAPRIRALVAGERIECRLAHGGAAFVTVRADGTTAFEIELDAAAAAARSDEVSPDRDRALAELSRGLDDRPAVDAGAAGGEAGVHDDD